MLKFPKDRDDKDHGGKDKDDCDDRGGKDRDHGWKGKDDRCDDKCDDKDHGKDRDRDHDKDYGWKGKDKDDNHGKKKDKDDKCDDKCDDKDHAWKGKDDKCDDKDHGKGDKDWCEPPKEHHKACNDPCGDDTSDLHGVLASMSDVGSMVEFAIDQLGSPMAGFDAAGLDLLDMNDSLGA